MSKEIHVPTLGESVTEATIGTWYKQVGEAVVADEPIVELETDKVTIEVPAPASGVLENIIAKTGDIVEVDALLGSIKEGATASAAPAPTAPAAKAEPATIANAPAKTSTTPPSPSAARMMEQKKIDPASVAGSGKRGQVLKEDVSAAASAPASAPAKQDEREDRVKMSRLRQTIAKRLKEAQNSAAMLTTFNEVDMQPIMNLRKEYKELFEKKHGVKLGFMGFFAKAVTHALKEIPAVNAEIDGTDIIYKNYANLGIAVGTPKGLVVPVVKDADQMSIADVEKEVGRLGRLGRDNKLSMDDMQGGTFTLSNGGVYGSLMSTPILNAPQSGILGMHKIQQRPVVVNGEIVIRPMMYLALSYDHRIVDGKEAVTFLVRVKESLEDPQRLVLDL